MKRGIILLTLVVVVGWAATAQAAIIIEPYTTDGTQSERGDWIVNWGAVQSGGLSSNRLRTWLKFDTTVTQALADPIVSATLHFNADVAGGIQVERFLSAVVSTGTNTGLYYRAADMNTGNQATGAGWTSVDVTAIVESWRTAGGGATDYGFKLVQGSGNIDLILPHEDPLSVPYLEVDDGVPIPEPMTMSLLAVGGVAALLRKRRRKLG